MKYPKLAFMTWSTDIAYIHMLQLAKIKIPDNNKKNNSFLFEIIFLKIFHFEKKIVVSNSVTVVHKDLCTTTSIWPAKEIYLKYITPKKPHQNEPAAVRNNPLLKFCLFNFAHFFFCWHGICGTFFGCRNGCNFIWKINRFFNCVILR